MERQYTFSGNGHIENFQHKPHAIHWFMQIPLKTLGALICVIGFILFITSMGSTSQYGGMIVIPIGMLLPFILKCIFDAEAREYYNDLTNCDKLDKNESREANFLFNLLQGEWTLSAAVAAACYQQQTLIHTFEGDIDSYQRYVKKQGLMTFNNKCEWYKNRKNGRLLLETKPMHTTMTNQAISSTFHFDLIKLNAPDELVMHDYMGNTYNWRRNSKWTSNDNWQSNGQGHQTNIAVNQLNPNPPAYNPNPPAYNPNPPAYTGSVPTAPAPASGKSMADKIRELNDLKNQGILTETEFQTAKTKVIQSHE